MRGRVVVIILLLVTLPVGVYSDAHQERIQIAGDHLSCSVAVPRGWRPYTSASGLHYLLPARQENENGTGIYVWATPREGTTATKLFDDDEVLTTADGEPVLVRYFRAGFFQSIIRPSDPTTPGAVAYIEEGDYFVEVVVGSPTDASFAEAKQVFKTVVQSYRRTPPN